MNKSTLCIAILLLVVLSAFNLPAGLQNPSDLTVTDRSFDQTGPAPGINPIGQFRLSYPSFQSVIDEEPDAEPYLPIVRDAVRSTVDTHPVDPLLVLALIKHESAFRRGAISYVGAAGPMQFIPSTARNMSLEPVFTNEAYDKGTEIHGDAYGHLSEAVSLMKDGHYERMKPNVTEWKTLSTRSEVLLNAYEQTLRQRTEGKSPEELKSIDQRFVPSLAVPAGVRYLSRMLSARDGDIREALSAYNAGPGNVNRYNGIPPFNQTVNYQNRIINTYQHYRQLALTSSET